MADLRARLAAVVLPEGWSWEPGNTTGPSLDLTDEDGIDVLTVWLGNGDVHGEANGRLGRNVMRAVLDAIDGSPDARP